MPIRPSKKELQGGKEGKQKFISRCIETEKNNGYEQDQAAAMCYKYWREAKNKKR